MQAEIISYVEVINKTIDIGDDTFFSDFINQVGPKGTFLNDRRTAKFIRDELWFPSLLDRNGYENWVKKGSTTMKSRCQEFKYEMLKKYQPQPLEADIDLDMQKLLNKAKKELSN